MTQRLARIGVMSAAKMSATLCFFIGILVAGLMFLFASAIGRSTSMPGSGMLGMGVGLIFVPVIYAVFAFIFGAIYAWLYNMVAAWVGGLELDLE